MELIRAAFPARLNDFPPASPMTFFRFAREKLGVVPDGRCQFMLPRCANQSSRLSIPKAELLEGVNFHQPTPPSFATPRKVCPRVCVHILFQEQVKSQTCACGPLDFTCSLCNRTVSKEGILQRVLASVPNLLAKSPGKRRLQRSSDARYHSYQHCVSCCMGVPQQGGRKRLKEPTVCIQVCRRIESAQIIRRARPGAHECSWMQ
jgi:hypothetical protein